MLAAWILPILMFAGPDFIDDPAPPPLNRVRPTSNIAKAMVADAAARSPTVAALITELNRSDVFVYIELQFDVAGALAQTTLLVANDAGRFLRIAVEASLDPRRRLELLAHELQHAVEIARAKEVRTDAAMRRLFSSIGWPMGERSYETAEAIDVERQTRRELGLRTTAASPAPRIPAVAQPGRIPG
jgi:hypothetical protein